MWLELGRGGQGPLRGVKGSLLGVGRSRQRAAACVQEVGAEQSSVKVTLCIVLLVGVLGGGRVCAATLRRRDTGECMRQRAANPYVQLLPLRLLLLCPGTSHLTAACWCMLCLFACTWPHTLATIQSRAVASDASGLYSRLPGGDVEAPAAPAATAGDMQRTWTSLFLHACK
jgi:hypothetical protein